MTLGRMKAGHSGFNVGALRLCSASVRQGGSQWGAVSASGGLVVAPEVAAQSATPCVRLWGLCLPPAQCRRGRWWPVGQTINDGLNGMLPALGLKAGLQPPGAIVPLPMQRHPSGTTGALWPLWWPCRGPCIRLLLHGSNYPLHNRCPTAGYVLILILILPTHLLGNFEHP